MDVLIMYQIIVYDYRSIFDNKQHIPIECKRRPFWVPSSLIKSIQPNIALNKRTSFETQTAYPRLHIFTNICFVFDVLNACFTSIEYTEKKFLDSKGNRTRGLYNRVVCFNHSTEELTFVHVNCGEIDPTGWQLLGQYYETHFLRKNP